MPGRGGAGDGRAGAWHRRGGFAGAGHHGPFSAATALAGPGRRYRAGGRRRSSRAGDRARCRRAGQWVRHSRGSYPGGAGPAAARAGGAPIHRNPAIAAIPDRRRVSDRLEWGQCRRLVRLPQLDQLRPRRRREDRQGAGPKAETPGRCQLELADRHRVRSADALQPDQCEFHRRRIAVLPDRATGPALRGHSRAGADPRRADGDHDERVGSHQSTCPDGHGVVGALLARGTAWLRGRALFGTVPRQAHTGKRLVSMAEWDILIRKGTIFDGSGRPGESGDVAIAAGRIAQIGRDLSGDAERVIDATGLAVTPGFIDIKTHSDFTLPINPKAESKVRQGVTTEIIGHCGFSVAPCLRGKVQMLADYLSGGAPWLPFRETRFPHSLDSFPAVAVNAGMLVGHNTLRLMVMGLEDRAPSAAELDRMCALLEEGLGAGALGLSTGLFPPPGR